MATTIQDVGFVDVAGSLEPKAIAASIATDAHTRVGELLALVDDWLREDDRALNQRQKIDLTATALRCMDGFEHETIDTLMRALRPIERSGDAS